MPQDDGLDRRDFLKQTGGLAAGSALATKAFAKASSPKTSSKVNRPGLSVRTDRINVGLVGCGGRGSSRCRFIFQVRPEQQKRLPDPGSF